MIAIPALKRTFSFKQPDRTSITLTTYGDEYLHFFITTDGIPVFETEKGVCYCDIINNELKITEINHPKELIKNYLLSTKRKHFFIFYKDYINKKKTKQTQKE